MRKLIDNLISEYEQSEEYKAEQPQTLIMGSRELNNGMIARITLRITPGNEGDAKFKKMPETFKFKGKYPELNPKI